MKNSAETLAFAAGSAAGAALLGAGVFFAGVMKDAKKGYKEPCSYLLVLGGEVSGADTPGHNLMLRMQTAEKYMHENPGVIAVPCGGCFRKEQKLSEAQIIKNYLLKSGIDENRIICENNSTTTIENFRFAKTIIEKHSGKDIKSADIAVLTSDYHLHRACIIAKLQGYGEIKKVSAKTDTGFMKGALREVICIPQLIDNFR